MIPSRISIGVRAVTIPNPAVLFAGEHQSKVFEGKCADYDFERQRVNFEKLQAVLKANGDDFNEVAAAHYPGDVGVNHRFVATTMSGNLLWNKYVGFAAQSGQNHVIMHGRRVKVSIFLGLDPEQQTALLTNTNIEQVFAPHVLKNINETDTLWN